MKKLLLAFLIITSMKVVLANESDQRNIDEMTMEQCCCDDEDKARSGEQEEGIEAEESDENADSRCSACGKPKPKAEEE